MAKSVTAPKMFQPATAKMRAAGMSWALILGFLQQHGSDILNMVDEIVNWFKTAPVAKHAARATACDPAVKEILDCQAADLACLIMDHCELCCKLDCCPDDPA